jgi:hypothetical protein
MPSTLTVFFQNKQHFRFQALLYTHINTIIPFSVILPAQLTSSLIYAGGHSHTHLRTEISASSPTQTSLNRLDTTHNSAALCRKPTLLCQ